ncbi:Bacteriophage protein [Mycobacteroides abscessus subsp. massiliense]|uniref:Gp37-like protein n=1 Tax=Mycobacteroides abscessus TaxID=36809 RepID=UPI0009A7A8CE|nr:Bacteriophage protein [Mycobacteroides abscessus subsp. massiliense]SKM97283.1 Bacteriophage protein [Mycobacteroides abscessus subsp. massiliense]SKN76180.1 Bacteriophage protein [Mycobacteroides abscessus subsp. massiliense]SKN96988.1 Bacteriophage protein [Mycobacteroides abscessus subsp. massiliense]SKO20856.1 Bacteriophage protein [Mycobacteroides abscessus subsp. massiliense]
MSTLLDGVDHGLITAPLEFTRWLDKSWKGMVGQKDKPNPDLDPMSAYRYLRGRRDVIESASRQRPLVRLFDKNMKQVAQVQGERQASVEELWTDSGQASCVIRYDNWLTEFILQQTKIHEDLHLVVDPIPTQTSWRTRWGGKVTGVIAKRDSSGIHTLELEAISNRQHAKNLLFAANPVFPPEIQLPKMWVLPGNTRTILSISMFINLARLFFPLLSIPTNAFNPFAWINGGITGLDPLSWPLQVAFVNPLLDQSRLSVIGAAWTDWHSAMDDMLKDAGCGFRAYTWLEEDEDSPHTELVDLARGTVAEDLVNDLTRPHRNCVVFAVEDKSGVTGPTGTAADGVINLIGATLDDMITETLFNLDQDQDGETDPLFRKLLGVAPEKPKTIWYEGQYSGIIESERRQHKGEVKTIMTGSRSPQIVNQAQTFAIRYALSQLAQVISYGIGAYQQYGSEGLDNLYQGQLDNTLFAWQRFTDPMRALRVGDLAWQEHFEKGGGTAYTLAGIVTLRLGHFNTRAWQGFTVSVINGRPHVVDVDVGLGDRAGFEQHGIIFTDQITAIRRTWSRTEPVTVHLSIGDDTAKQDPTARGLRALQAVWTTLSHFLGEGTLF